MSKGEPLIVLDDLEPLASTLARAEAAEQQAADLAAALLMAHEHVSELREAWERGVIREGDNLGGTRSNRNMDVCVALRHALTDEEGR